MPSTLWILSLGRKVSVDNATKRVGRIAMNTEDGSMPAGIIPDVFVDTMSIFGRLTGNPALSGPYVIEAENNAGSTCTGLGLDTGTPGMQADCPTVT